MTEYREADLGRARTLPVAARLNRVDRDTLARVPDGDLSFRSFLACLPRALAAEDLKRVAQSLARAHRERRGVLLLVGGHVIKVGLGPLLADWIRRGVVTHLALNGAAAIHDYELAAWGGTSEDVERGLEDGSFGMARETGEEMNQAIVAANGAGAGLGEGLATRLAGRSRADGGEGSVLIACHRGAVPVTVHPTVGAEILHQHPSADGAAIGATALRDFRRLAGSLPDLHDGGVVLNLGSAVVLPEVFLKALSVARNLGEGRPTGFLAADFDMIRHYRPRVNVVERPTRAGGTGLMFTGHHEIMVPLLYWAVQDALATS